MDTVTNALLGVNLARRTFEETCTQCHSTRNVERKPPASVDEARALVARMVENGLEAEQDELEQVVFFLVQTYVKL